MNKNIKSIFFIAILIALLISITAISATDINNGTDELAKQDVVKEVNVEKVSDTKITDTKTKNIKEEQKTDLYVSNTQGSDENDGTNISPYKTIQKALDNTNAESTYNIHLNEGTYKGLGNTNLTINGNYNINIIGEGNVIIDGEAKYDVKTELLPGEYYWDSSPEWYPFENASGNYAMNITTGVGVISLSNLTIQNCYNPGGNSINAYPTSTVDNYANLIVDNVKFLNNCAGVGGAIRNNHDATVTVTNSIFDGNRKSSSSGNDGGAIYNNGTANIDNSNFTDNWSRWGTILNDAKLTITNSLFKDNHAYDGSSTYKYGSGIASDSSQADFFNPYSIESIETIIDNCTFSNNGQTDIWQGNGYLLVNNSKFTNSTGIFINANSSTSSQIIVNNQILNPKFSNIFGSLSVNSDTLFGIRSQNSPSLTVENNIFTGTNGNALYINSNAIIKNNSMQTSIQITGNNTLITQNTINTTRIYTINVANRTTNHTITNNILESSMLYGDTSVNSTTALIENNMPKLGQIVNITDETYSNYFDDDGYVINGTIETKSKVNLQGDFNNKTFIIDKLHLIITATGKLYNSTFVVKDEGQVVATNIKITNYNTTDKYALLIESEENIFTGLNINVNSIYPTHAIIIMADNNEITGTATVRGPSNPVTNMNGLTDTMALDIQSSNNIISTGNMNAYSNYNNTNGTITSINIQSIDKEANNNTIYNVGATAWYGDNAYAIRIINSSNNTIYEATTRYSIRAEYAYNTPVGIYIAGKSHNNQIQKTGYMYVSKHNGFSEKGYVLTNSNVYGIIVKGSSDNNIINTTIKSTSSAQILLNNTINTTLDSNGLGSIGNFTGIMVSNSDNTILNNIQATLPDRNVTTILIENSNNTSITNSSLKADQTIILNNSINNTVIDNYLNIKDMFGGDETVTVINSTGNTIKNNTPIIKKLTDDTYYQFFDENHRLNTTYDFVVLDSDLYNKDLIIPNRITLLNPQNYTIYNGSLSLIENSGGSNITGLNFYSNDERTNIIYINANRTYVDHATIYQENHENIIRTIILENNTSYNGLRWANIHILGPEIKTDDNTASTLLIITGYGNQKLLSLSNITIESTKTDNQGYITAIKSEITGLGSTLGFASTNINITGNNLIAIDETRINSQYVNITLNSNNHSTILKLTNATNGIFRYNNYMINSNNSAIIWDINNFNDSFSSSFESCNITVNSPNIIVSNVINSTRGTVSTSGNFNITTNNLTLLNAVNSKASITNTNIDNLECDELTIINATNSTGTIISNNINVTTTKNNGIIITNNSNYTFYNYWNGNNININTSTSTPLININNSIVDIQKNNLTQNTTNTPIILIENSNATIINNSFITMDLLGDNAVEVLNSTATVENNTPTQQPTIINIETQTLNQLISNDITITVKDIFNNAITGQIIAQINNQTLIAENNIVTYTPTTADNITITVTYKDPNNKYNTNNTTKILTVKPVQLIVNPITAQIGETINITAQITSANTTANVNVGKVTFKVNGKTLKDENNKIIYAKVINGTATIEDYVVPKSWDKEELTIEAVYSGSSQLSSLKSEKTNITIIPKELSLTTEPITATAGSTTTITTTLSDNTINNGKITIKINGKTLKDANGKIIYAKIVNGVVTVDYNIPKTLKEGNYTITATYISTTGEKITSNSTLTINKA